MPSINLNQIGISIEGDEFRSIADNLQGNILKSHGRGHTSHIFFKFNPNKQREAKLFIQKFAETKLTSAAQQERDAQQFRYESRQKFFFGFYLTAKGYDFLGVPANKKPSDNAFLNGQKGSKDKLLDPEFDTWDIGFQGDIHASILIGYGTPSREMLDKKTEKIVKELRKNGLATILAIDEGDAIKNNNNDDIEHFGYVDGISQPRFFTEDLNNVTTSNWNPLMPISLVLVPDPSIAVDNAFGSYFVFRKLEQNVREFKKAESRLAQELFNDPENELAGAMLVGRFKNGMPVTLSSTATNSEIANNNTVGKINDFNYGDDTKGAKCPFHAHIRKTNPRGESVKQGVTAEQEKAHTMARRGIIYGKRHVLPQDKPSFDEMPTKDVGLLFMSFQASIEKQFEFIQKQWANNDDFVNENTGKDGIIGQGSFHPDVQQQRYATIHGDKDSIKVAQGFGKFVTLKGGEYFFAPSVSFLKTINSAEIA